MSACYRQDSQYLQPSWSTTILKKQKDKLAEVYMENNPGETP